MGLAEAIVALGLVTFISLLFKINHDFCKDNKKNIEEDRKGIGEIKDVLTEIKTNQKWLLKIKELENRTRYKKANKEVNGE